MKKLKQKVFLFILLMPTLANAQSIVETRGGLDAAVAGTGLPQKTTSEMIGLIINAALSILGALFLTLVIIGGFKWMTSQGNTEQIGEAKKTISNSIIGLVIVIASYVIVNTVFQRLSGELGSGGNVNGVPGP